MEHNFKKKFGQNFLSDKNLLQAIVDDAEINENDNVLEIGAGAGALTSCLSQKAKRVVAYEIDKELENVLASLHLENVEFIFADALKEPIKKIEENFKGEKYKLVANLPYYITTPLIFKFLEEGTKLVSLTIMVQKEVAERIVAKPGGKDYGVLSVMTNFFGKTEITRIVGRNMFYPMPNVDSAVVNIMLENKHVEVDKKGFYEFIKICFSMRRKTLLNNLSGGYKISKENLVQDLKGFDLTLRPEKLSLDEFIILFKQIKNKI